MNLRTKILAATDSILAATIVTLLLSSVFCFGGAVWWFRPVAAVLAFVLAGAQLLQQLIRGRLPILKSPLSLFGIGAIGLAVLQLVALPSGLARRVSPAAQELYSCATFPALARADYGSELAIEPAPIRSPATLDRAATLRYVVTALVCLATFWAVSHFADRLSRLYLIWGTVLAAFFVNAAFAAVQITGQVDGLLGWMQPGRAPAWAPSTVDLLETPNLAVLRRLDGPPAAGVPQQMVTMALTPERRFLFGTMVGGAGSFLAYGSLALPLALALLLYIVAPRGSREGFGARLGHSGQGSLVVLLVIMLALSAFLSGLLAGPVFCAVFAVALAAVGLPASRTLGWWAAGLTVVLSAVCGLGAALALAWPALFADAPPIAPLSWELSAQIWNDCLSIFKSFPLVGTGFGSFGAVHPYSKTHDLTSTTAMSSLVQCGVESGLVGLTLLGLAGCWLVCRVRPSLKRVGSADKTLAYGLVGAGLGLGLWSIVQWTVELPAVAIAASAIGGIGNRWLAGGTDLFVERR